MLIMLIAGLLIFTGLHLLPALVPARQVLVNRLGQNLYLGLYALISLSALVLIIIGKIYAEFTPIWNPPTWSKHATMLLMSLSFILFAAADMPSNIKRFTRHPMLWGVVVWSLAHLLANGDLASMLLFAGFGLYAVVVMPLLTRRGDKKQTRKYPFYKDLILAVAAISVYLVVLFLHPYLFGVAIV